MSTYIPKYIRYVAPSEDEMNQKFIDLANTELQLRYCKYLTTGFTVEEAKSKAAMEVLDLMWKGELK